MFLFQETGAEKYGIAPLASNYGLELDRDHSHNDPFVPKKFATHYSQFL